MEGTPNNVILRYTEERTTAPSLLSLVPLKSDGKGPLLQGEGASLEDPSLPHLQGRQLMQEGAEVPPA